MGGWHQGGQLCLNLRFFWCARYQQGVQRPLPVFRGPKKSRAPVVLQLSILGVLPQSHVFLGQMRGWLQVCRATSYLLSESLPVYSSCNVTSRMKSCLWRVNQSTPPPHPPTLSSLLLLLLSLLLLPNLLFCFLFLILFLLLHHSSVNPPSQLSLPL